MPLLPVESDRSSRRCCWRSVPRRVGRGVLAVSRRDDSTQLFDVIGAETEIGESVTTMCTSSSSTLSSLPHTREGCRSTGSIRARASGEKVKEVVPPLSPALVYCAPACAPAQAPKKSKKWCVRRPGARVMYSERTRHGRLHRRSENTGSRHVEYTLTDVDRGGRAAPRTVAV